MLTTYPAQSENVWLRLESWVSSHKKQAPHSSPVKTSGYVGDGQRGVEGCSNKRSGAVLQISHIDVVNTQELFRLTAARH